MSTGRAPVPHPPGVRSQLLGHLRGRVHGLFTQPIGIRDTRGLPGTATTFLAKDPKNRQLADANACLLSVLPWEGAFHVTRVNRALADQRSLFKDDWVWMVSEPYRTRTADRQRRLRLLLEPSFPHRRDASVGAPDGFSDARF